jgi:pimeloyl-ACP methyl ester carboxylesterase
MGDSQAIERALGAELLEPLVIVHGFPTCSYDYRKVVAGLASNRRVLLVDLPGFGLSSKPDMRYSIETHADVVAAYVAELGVDRLALLTHDMGDTVGGELLARNAEGAWPVDVTRRVLTNGSIYLKMAHLTDGQQLLLSLPDAAVEVGPDPAALAGALAATMATGSLDARNDVAGDAELICKNGGNTLLTRTIRYVEDRRRAEDRYTGAIETHPSPLGVVWGTEDPIAVRQMVSTLAERRPEITVSLLEGVGHYPMLEAPGDFVSAVNAFLQPD